MLGQEGQGTRQAEQIPGLLQLAAPLSVPRTARWPLVIEVAQGAGPPGLRPVASMMVVGAFPDVVQPGAGVVEHAVAQQCQDVGGGQGAGDPGEPGGQRGDREQ